MWQAEHAAAMCRALQGQATALPKAPAAQSSSNCPAASLLQGGARAWCWVIVALKPHSSAVCVYDRGENAALTIPPAHLEALHLGALSSDEGTARTSREPWWARRRSGSAGSTEEMPSA